MLHVVIKQKNRLGDALKYLLTILMNYYSRCIQDKTLSAPPLKYNEYEYVASVLLGQLFHLILAPPKFNISELQCGTPLTRFLQLKN